MTIIGSASVEIRAIDRLFKKDVEDAVKKLKDVHINVTAKFNDTEARKSLDDLRKQLKDETVEIKANLEDDAAKKKLDDMRKRAQEDLTVRAVADTELADRDLTQLRESHDDKPATVQAVAETTAASAQMRTLARSRVATIHPIVDSGAYATALAALESLAGINTLRTFKDALKDLAVGFDTGSLKALTMSSAVMGLVSSLGWLGAEAFAAGEGIASLVGFATVAPALMAALAATFVTNHLAWNGFADALSDDAKKAEKALAKLPPAARTAAKEVKSIWNEVKKPVQGAFWDKMGTSMQDAFAAAKKQLQKGLTDTGASMGSFTAKVMTGFQRIAADKGMEHFFGMLNKGIGNLEKGVLPVMGAFQKLLYVGSGYIPQLTQWMADLGIQFSEFIDKAVKSGDIWKWIENAKAAAKDLWDIGGATIGIFEGLTTIMQNAGAKGLDGMAKSLQGVEKIIKGPVFQSQMSQIFSGMLLGAHAVKEGFAEVGKAMGDMSTVIGPLFTLAGGVVKELLVGVSALLRVGSFQEGLVVAFGSLKQLFNDLEPSFEAAGRIFGTLLRISGQIFNHVAPVINTVTELIADALESMEDGILVVIPVLMNFIKALVDGFSGPIKFVAETIGQIAEAFAGLPTPVANAVAAMGLALILLPKFKGLLSGFGQGMRDAAAGSENARSGFTWLNDAKKWADDSSKSIGNSFGNLRESMTKSMTLGRDASANLRAAGSMAARDFGNGFKGALSATGFVAKEIGGALGKIWDTPGMQEARGGIKNGFNTALKDAFSDVGENFKQYKQDLKYMGDTTKYYGQVAGQHIGNFANTAKTHFTRLPEYARTAFTAMEMESRPFRNNTQYLFEDLAESAEKKTRDMRNDVRGNFDMLKEAAAQHAVYTQKRFEDASDAVRSGSTAAAGYIRNAVSTATTALAPAAERLRGIGTAASEGMSRAAGAIQTRVGDVVGRITEVGTAAAAQVTRAASGVHGAGRAAGQTLSGAFTPVGGAFRALASSIGEGAGNIRTHIGNIGSAAGGAARSLSPLTSAVGGLAGAMGRSAGGGLRLAAGGLMNMLGGPWGIALAGATTAVAIFGEAQANAKAKVDGLAGTLDKQTGAFTAQSKKMIATDFLDVDASAWDDLWRSGRRNMEELARDTQLNTDKITEALSNPEGRDAFLDNWRRLRDAAGDGSDVSEELAATVNMTKAQMESLSDTDLNEMVRQFENAAETAKQAEAQVQAVAKATGTNNAQAAILTANYETLASKTSSASDRFNALKSNLDILNDKQLTATNSTKAYQQTLDDTKNAIKAVADANGGVVKNLVDVKGNFDLTKQAGRDLHTALEGQADSILQLGTAAMDRAIKGGADAEAASKAAMGAMAPAIGALRKQLADLGFAPPQIDAITKSLGLVPKDVRTALKVEGGEAARQDILLTELAAKAFATGEYDAVLAALPAAAKEEIERTTGLANAFAKGDYDAILKALDKTEGGRAAALAKILTVSNGKYDALLTAKDGTKLGTDSAKGTIRTVQGKVVTIAAHDAASSVIELVRQRIAGLQDRMVTVTTNYTEKGNPGTAGRGTVYAGMNGGIFKGNHPVPGYFGMNSGIGGIQAFANGGLSGLPKLLGSIKAYATGGFENHVAQISRGQTPFRVWSEPETGGEAYIPLSIMKRARSTKILEMVAKMFGFGLFKQFAEGGFDGTSNNVGHSTPVFAQPTNFNPTSPAVVNVYPSPGLDEERVGRMAAHELYWKLINR